MLDRITGWDVFLKVASLGSFSAAARTLGMSPAMAAKHVDALERRLGVRLLFRTTRRLNLTEAGRSFLDSCARILPEIKEAESALAAGQTAIEGLLRINLPVSFGTRQIVPLLDGFLARHPGVTIELGLNDRVVDPLDEGWNLVLRIAPLADNRLTVRRLAPCRILFAASPAYLERRGVPRNAADLTQHDCLGYTLSRSGRADQWRFGPGREDVVTIRGPLSANNGDALLAAAIAGLGIIHQPSFLLADAIRAGQLTALPLSLPGADLPGIFALHPHGRHPPAKVRAMIDYLAECLSPIPPWDRDLEEPHERAGTLIQQNIDRNRSAP